MKDEDKLEILNRLKFLYTDIPEISIFTKDDKGILYVGTKRILKFNPEIAALDIQQRGDEAINYYYKMFAEYIDKKYMPRKNYYQKGQGRPTANLTEAQIRMAIANTKSNRSAAQYLNVSYNTYAKYAKMYVDKETGKTLHELHRNQEGRGITKVVQPGTRIPLEIIFANERPTYNRYLLKKRLVQEHILEEKCAICGYDERRWEDGKTPLQLDFIDGNTKNFAKENLRLLCYNHVFHIRGRIEKNQMKKLEREIRDQRYKTSEKKQNELFDKFQDGLNKTNDSDDVFDKFQDGLNDVSD